MSTRTCFDWPSRLRRFSEPGLSSCIEDGRLTLDGRRVSATRIDLYALRLVEWAIARGESLVICPPEPFGPLPALAAAAAHISNIASYRQRTGRAAGSDLRVAVVTSSTRQRGIYRRLGIATAPLFDVVPAATRTHTGGISILGHDAGRGWSTIFLDRLSDVASLDRVDLTVVELPLAPHTNFETVLGPVVVVANDPADPLIRTLASDLPVFAWDDTDLAALPSVGIVEGSALVENRLRLERAAAGIECRPMPVRNQAICENASLFWQDIGPLLRASRRSPFGRELAASAFVLFYDLMHLALPTETYEAASRPLRVRVREIENSQRLVSGDLKDLYVPMVAVELEDLAAAIGPRSPKTDILLSVLREHADHADDILLVARTAELARVYETYLQSIPEVDGAVRVTSLWGVANEPPAAIAVLVGLLPASARYLYTTGIAAEIIVLAYDTESPLNSVPDGFVEFTQVHRALRYQQAYSAWLARPAAKSACWARLSGEHVALADDQPDPPRVDHAVAAEEDATAPPEAPPGLWDGSSASLADLERRLARDVPPRLSANGDGTNLEVDAVRVDFTDGRHMYVDAGSSVTRWRSRGGTPEAGYLAWRIAEGDELLFLDGEARKDLLAKVLEVAEDVPELAVPAAWIDYWRDALRRAHDAFHTYEGLHRELETRGCVRQTQTVRLWVVGQTIGPEDPEDIRRLGECLGDSPLVDNYRAVASAMQALRNAHVRLGQRLGALARQVGPQAGSGLIDEDEIIDERTGITASDFRDAVEILAVRSVRPAGRIPFALAGILRAADESEVELA
jgi:hypothetical protein